MFVLFQSILVQIRAEILSDPNACLEDKNPDREYDVAEARSAFKRMTQRYGWEGPTHVLRAFL